MPISLTFLSPSNVVLLPTHCISAILAFAYLLPKYSKLIFTLGWLTCSFLCLESSPLRSITLGPFLSLLNLLPPLHLPANTCKKYSNVTQRWNGRFGRKHLVDPHLYYEAEKAAAHKAEVAHSGHMAADGHQDQAPVSHLLVHWNTCFSGSSVGKKEEPQDGTGLEMLQATFSRESEFRLY